MTTRSKWLPVLLYAIGFFALSPHLPSHFSSGIWADGGDGTSNYWYFWWIRKAIVELHQSPFFTK
ncbi:MAG: hypothetical protein ACXVBW_08565, partial [Bdellovibrionota bacterium]